MHTTCVWQCIIPWNFPVFLESAMLQHTTEELPDLGWSSAHSCRRRRPFRHRHDPADPRSASTNSCRYHSGFLNYTGRHLTIIFRIFWNRLLCNFRWSSLVYIVSRSQLVRLRRASSLTDSFFSYHLHQYRRHRNLRIHPRAGPHIRFLHPSTPDPYINTNHLRQRRHHKDLRVHPHPGPPVLGSTPKPLH